MLPYVMLFGFFAFGAVLQREPERTDRPSFMPMLFLGGAMIALLVGLRYEVGADWPAYELYFSFARHADLWRVLQLNEPAYQFTNWLVQRAGLGLWGVNLICGSIFAWGLVRFARVQPEPWLAMAVAIPYLVTVVGMGYTRQAVAIGILMAGLATVLRGGSVLRFSAYVLVAAMFHRTSVLILPLVLFAGERNRLLTLIGGAAIFALLYDTLLASSVDNLIRNYIEAEYSSQGAVVRVGMSVIAALLFLLRPEKFGFSSFEQRVWRYFSYVSLGFVLLFFVLPSSAAIDRMALYTVPLQLAVLSRAPIAYPATGVRSTVIIYSLAVQLVWLNFATHAQFWLPYRFYPFD